MFDFGFVLILKLFYFGMSLMHQALMLITKPEVKIALGTEADTGHVAKALCSMSVWPGP